MKSEEILEIIPSTEFPIGLGGCHADQTNFDCCVYDITVFDHTGESESIIEKNNKFFKIHHCGLNENRVEILIQLQNMQILSADHWELQLFFAKINDKLIAMGNLLEKADKIIIAAGAAYTFIKANGGSIGSSIYDEGMVEWAKEVYGQYKNKIVLPIDHLISQSVDDTDSCLIVNSNIPDGFSAFDIGPKTTELFNSIIKAPGYIFWNGPMGVFESDTCSSGTIHVARAVALAKLRGATSVVGGGETIAAVRKAEVLESEISQMSTGGGALLEYIGGVNLPGIEILD